MMIRGLSVGSIILLAGGVLVGGCSTRPEIHQPQQTHLAAKAVPRLGTVTKEMILLEGGFCGENDVCFDRKSQQNFDCDVEFSCVLTSLNPSFE